MALNCNWHECRRLLIDAWPGLLFLSVLALSLWLPSRLLGDVASGILIGSLILQFSGLLTAAYGLRKRGVLFDRVPPWTATWNWVRSIKRVFHKPKAVTVEVDAALTAMGGSGVGVTVSAGQKTLEQRIDELEKRIEQLREADRKLRKDMTAKIRAVRDFLTTESKELRTELREVQAKLDRSAVGNFPWEWVGLGWLVAGVSFRIVAEFLRDAGGVVL